MAYSVDWIAKQVVIPTSDLTLVSGTRYSLNMTDFLTEIRRLEWDPAEGLWAPAIVEHTNTRFDFAGANYAPFDAIINGYTIEFSNVTATRVDLLGSNNNIIDNLVANGVQVVPSNSAGLQIVSTGSGLDAGQDAKLTAINTQLANIEGSEDHKGAMRLILSAVQGILTGAGTTNIKTKSLDGTKTRLDIQNDAIGNRNSVTRDSS